MVLFRWWVRERNVLRIIRLMFVVVVDERMDVTKVNRTGR